VAPPSSGGCCSITGDQPEPRLAGFLVGDLKP
jgi:hypothetical protein